MRSLFGERLFLPFFGRNPLRFYEPGNVFVVKRGGLRSLHFESMALYYAKSKQNAIY